MNALVGAGACAAAAAMIAVASYAGIGLLATAVAVVVLALAAGWGQVLRLPDVRGSGIVIAGTGLIAVAVAVIDSPDTAPVAGFAPLIALAVLVAFAHELVRPGRERIVESVTGTLSGQVLAVLAAGWVLLPAGGVGQASVLIAAAAVVAARLVMAPDPPGAGWIALGAGALAAGLVSLWVPVELVPAAVTGLVVAAGAAGLERLLAPTAEDHIGAGLLAAAAAPLAASGTVAYAAVRILLT